MNDEIKDEERSEVAKSGKEGSEAGAGALLDQGPDSLPVLD